MNGNTMMSSMPRVEARPLPRADASRIVWSPTVPLVRKRDFLTDWIGAPFASRWPVVWPLISLALFTALFRWTSADLAISSLFYDHAAHQWIWFFNSGCTLFYRGGTYPAFFLCGSAVILLLKGQITRDWATYRAGWFLLLLFGIGPGLIVNYGFKNHWGRPRPHQVVNFDGTHAFVSVGSPGTLQHNNSSFPSGHAAVAFYMMAPAFLVSPRRRGWPTKLMLVGLCYGGAMSVVRVIQGGHFVSDVVWSAAIVYFTAVVLSALILGPRERSVGTIANSRTLPQSRAAA